MDEMTKICCGLENENLKKISSNKKRINVDYVATKGSSIDNNSEIDINKDLLD